MKCSCDDWIGGVVCKDVVLMYVIICVVDLRCLYGLCGWRFVFICRILP